AGPVQLGLEPALREGHLPACRTAGEVVLEPGPTRVVTFQVHQQRQAAAGGVAVDLLPPRTVVGHHFSPSYPSRPKPRSVATSRCSSRSCLRPRCRRDITVPSGVSMISAISLYGRSWTSA